MSEDATGLLYWPEPDQQIQFYQRYFTIIIEGIYFKRGSLYMTKRDFSIYLDDILKNMQIAEEFLSNTTFKKFAKDTKTSYAVIRCLEIIGEAVKHIPTGVRNKYPEVPWKAMGGISWRIII
ncbi:MAG: DUF86 domain-containing protein [Elusimicrobia bacterium]|nr:DUF86 domain-containing protein [Elusimicrobiota bacterium]